MMHRSSDRPPTVRAMEVQIHTLRMKVQMQLNDGPTGSDGGDLSVTNRPYFEGAATFEILPGVTSIDAG